MRGSFSSRIGVSPSHITVVVCIFLVIWLMVANLCGRDGVGRYGLGRWGG